RSFDQNGAFPGSAFGYRSKEEEREWRQRDPIDQVTAHLLRRDLADQEQIDATFAAARDVMAEIGDVLLEPLPGGRPGQRRIKESEWPDPGFADVGVRGDLSEFDGAPTADVDTYAGELQEQKFIEAVAAVMNR